MFLGVVLFLFLKYSFLEIYDESVISWTAESVAAAVELMIKIPNN